MLDREVEISLRKQALLLNVSRSRVYYRPVINDDSEIANLISEIYLSSDCRYGYRKIAADLLNRDIVVNKKRVLRLMQEMGLEGLYPKRFVNTSIKNAQHKIYPYLLKDLDINKQNQVWASDITYIKMDGYFMYFVAIIDLFSRYIISYNLSHSLELESFFYPKSRRKNINIPFFTNDKNLIFYSICTIFGFNMSGTNKLEFVCTAYGIKSAHI